MEKPYDTCKKVQQEGNASAEPNKIPEAQVLLPHQRRRDVRFRC
jgi:hypothetical protein